MYFIKCTKYVFFKYTFKEMSQIYILNEIYALQIMDMESTFGDLSHVPG